MVNNEIEGNSWKLITNREELCLKLVRLFEKKKEMSLYSMNAQDSLRSART